MSQIGETALTWRMNEIDLSLEIEYDNRALVPDHLAIFARWRESSTAFRAEANVELDLHYGTAERHRLDLFHAKNPRGTVVFIHGGYWRSLDKSDFSFVAAPFVADGLSVAAFNYRLCPVDRVADTIDDCRAALVWLLANGQEHGVAVDRVALSGHSAGGHLVSMLFATDWPRRDVDPSRIVGGVALSGVFDLAPLLNCSMNDDLKMDATSACAASPIHHRSTLSAPLHLAVGGRESRAFIEQTHKLQRAWPATCPVAEEIAERNHFTIVDEFVRPESNAFQFVRRLFA